MAGTDFDVRIKLEAGSAQAQLRQMQGNLQGVEREASGAGRTLNTMEKRLKDLTNELKNTEVGSRRFKELADEVNRAEKSLNQASGAAKNVSGGFRLAQAAATGFMTALSTAAINAAVAAIGQLSKTVAGTVTTFASFESSMNNVAALTGATGGRFADLEKKARELGASTKFSASEVADAMGFLGMAGFETEEILASTKTMLDLAAAGNLDLAKAADIASNVMGQFGIAASDADRVTNLLAATAASANTNVEQLSEAMVYLGPTAASLGISIEETAAIIGVLGDAGIQGSMAGRALGTALVRLTNPTNQIAGAISELNLQIADSNGSFVTFEDLLRQIEKATADYTPTQKAATLSALLGAEAYQEINILLDRGADAYANYTKEITDTNRAQEIAEIQSEGLGGAWKTLLSAAEGLAIAMGQSLAPAVQSATEKITEIITIILGGDGGVAATSQMASASESLALAIDGIDGKSAAAEIQRVINAIGGLLQAVDDFMRSPIVKGFMWFMGYWAEGFTAFNNPELQNQYRNQQQNERAIMFGMDPPNPGYGTRDSVLNNTFDDRQRQSYNLIPPPPAAPPSQDTAPSNAIRGTLPPPPESLSPSASSAAQKLSREVQAIIEVAKQVDQSVLDVATVLAQESSFKTNAINGIHQGLWQAGTSEQAWAKNFLGIPSSTPWTSVDFATQLQAWPAWLASRGYRPGMSREEFYATTLGGNPANMSSDSNGTSPTTPFSPGHPKVQEALAFLRRGGYQEGMESHLSALTQTMFNQEPFLTNPMAVGIGADPLGAKQMMFDVGRQKILESYNATNEAIAQQAQLIERRLELASEDALTRDHILELEERDRDAKEALAELEQELQAQYKAGSILQEDIAQQVAERTVAETRLTAAILDRQSSEVQAREDAIAYQQTLEAGAIYAERLAEQQAQAREYVDRLTDGFTNLAVNVISGATSMEQALGQLFNTILSYLANQAFQSLFGQLFGGLFGLGGGPAVAAPIGPDPFNLLPFANGGVISGGFRAFADGGVVNRPTLGLVGEGSMNEAVVPLPNGRAIPVEMRGGGTNITVNVNNPGTGEDGRRLGKQISEAIRSELINQRRTGGLLAR